MTGKPRKVLRPFAPVLFIAWVVFVLLLVWVLVASLAQARRSSSPHRYPAIIRCDRLAEDSAAHVRIVEYSPTDDGAIHLVYRCVGGGW